MRASGNFAVILPFLVLMATHVAAVPVKQPDSLGTQPGLAPKPLTPTLNKLVFPPINPPPGTGGTISPQLRNVPSQLPAAVVNNQALSTGGGGGAPKVQVPPGTTTRIVKRSVTTGSSIRGSAAPIAPGTTTPGTATPGTPAAAVPAQQPDSLATRPGLAPPPLSITPAKKDSLPINNPRSGGPVSPGLRGVPPQQPSPLINNQNLPTGAGVALKVNVSPGTTTKRIIRRSAGMKRRLVSD